MSDLTCENCGEPRGADDVFCENCGFDFLGGSLPESEVAASPSAETTEAAEVTETPDPSQAEISELATAETVNPGSSGEDSFEQVKLHIAVEVDRSQFDKVVQEGEVTFPDPVPARQVLELAGTEFHIGRTSESRAIHPDLDILELTGDEAVSGRHAMIEIDRDGTYSITDLGSTNGTTAGSIEEELLIQGKKTPIKVGSTIFVGAWTKLTVLDPEASGK